MFSDFSHCEMMARIWVSFWDSPMVLSDVLALGEEKGYIERLFCSPSKIPSINFLPSNRVVII